MYPSTSTCTYYVSYGILSFFLTTIILLPDLFSLEGMGILLLTPGKAAIKSLLSKQSYWFHSNHLQVMVLLSMYQNDRIKP